MSRLPRPCLGCGGLIPSGSYCTECDPHREAYGGSWQRIAARTVKAWRATHGDVCPGWQREPHESSDLVVDHDLGVLCRSCNSVKGNTFDRDRAMGRRR